MSWLCLGTHVLCLCVCVLVCVRYVDTITSGKTVVPKLLSLSKVAEAWRTLSVDDLVAEPYYIRRQDAVALCAAAPFLMDDNSTVASTSTTLTLATINTMNTNPVAATVGNPVGSPLGTPSGNLGSANPGSALPLVSEQVWHQSCNGVTSTVLQLGGDTEDPSSNDGAPSLLPPLQPPPVQLTPEPTKEADPDASSVASTLQSGVVAEVEVLIDKFKRRHGHRVRPLLVYSTISTFVMQCLGFRCFL